MKDLSRDDGVPVEITLQPMRDGMYIVQAYKRRHGQLIGQTIGYAPQDEAQRIAETAAALLRFAGVPVQLTQKA